MLTSTKNAFVGLDADCDGCNGATYAGNWWVSGGELFIESIITWEGDRDRGKGA